MLCSAERSWSTASFRIWCLQKQDFGWQTVHVDPAPENAGTHEAGLQWAGVTSHCREWEIISQAQFPFDAWGRVVFLQGRSWSKYGDVKLIMFKAVIPIRLRYLESRRDISSPKSDGGIPWTRLLTAFPSSTYLIPVLWTTVLSHCSYSDAGRGKNRETHYAERWKNFNIRGRKLVWLYNVVKFAG